MATQMSQSSAMRTDFEFSASFDEQVLLWIFSYLWLPEQFTVALVNRKFRNATRHHELLLDMFQQILKKFNHHRNIFRNARIMSTDIRVLIRRLSSWPLEINNRAILQSFGSMNVSLCALHSDFCSPCFQYHNQVLTYTSPATLMTLVSDNYFPCLSSSLTENRLKNKKLVANLGDSFAFAGKDAGSFICYSIAPFTSILNTGSNILIKLSCVAYFEVEFRNLRSNGNDQEPHSAVDIGVEREEHISLGLACPLFPLKRRRLGDDSNSFGYHHDGKLCHGSRFLQKNGPSFNDGDIIGCGIIYPPLGKKNGRIFFTKNGSVVEIIDLGYKGLLNLPWFPAVCCSSMSNAHVQFNYGVDVPFTFNLEKFEADLLREEDAERASSGQSPLQPYEELVRRQEAEFLASVTKAIMSTIPPRQPLSSAGSTGLASHMLSHPAGRHIHTHGQMHTHTPAQTLSALLPPPAPEGSPQLTESSPGGQGFSNQQLNMTFALQRNLRNLTLPMHPILKYPDWSWDSPEKSPKGYFRARRPSASSLLEQCSHSTAKTTAAVGSVVTTNTITDLSLFDGSTLTLNNTMMGAHIGIDPTRHIHSSASAEHNTYEFNRNMYNEESKMISNRAFTIAPGILPNQGGSNNEDDQAHGIVADMMVQKEGGQSDQENGDNDDFTITESADSRADSHPVSANTSANTSVKSSANHSVNKETHSITHSVNSAHSASGPYEAYFLLPLHTDENVSVSDFAYDEASQSFMVMPRQNLAGGANRSMRRNPTMSSDGRECIYSQSTLLTEEALMHHRKGCECIKQSLDIRQSLFLHPALRAATLKEVSDSRGEFANGSDASWEGAGEEEENEEDEDEESTIMREHIDIDPILQKRQHEHEFGFENDGGVCSVASSEDTLDTSRALPSMGRNLAVGMNLKRQRLNHQERQLEQTIEQNNFEGHNGDFEQVNRGHGQAVRNDALISPGASDLPSEYNDGHDAELSYSNEFTDSHSRDPRDVSMYNDSQAASMSPYSDGAHHDQHMSPENMYEQKSDFLNQQCSDGDASVVKGDMGEEASDIDEHDHIQPVGETVDFVDDDDDVDDDTSGCTAISMLPIVGDRNILIEATLTGAGKDAPTYLFAWEYLLPKNPEEIGELDQPASVEGNSRVLGLSDATMLQWTQSLHKAVGIMDEFSSFQRNHGAFMSGQVDIFNHLHGSEEDLDGEADSLATSLYVEVASLDDRGSFIGYGAASDTDDDDLLETNSHGTKDSDKGKRQRALSRTSTDLIGTGRREIKVSMKTQSTSRRTDRSADTQLVGDPDPTSFGYSPQGEGGEVPIIAENNFGRQFDQYHNTSGGLYGVSVGDHSANHKARREDEQVYEYVLDDASTGHRSGIFEREADIDGYDGASERGRWETDVDGMDDLEVDDMSDVRSGDISPSGSSTSRRMDKRRRKMALRSAISHGSNGSFERQNDQHFGAMRIPSSASVGSVHSGTSANSHARRDTITFHRIRSSENDYDNPTNMPDRVSVSYGGQKRRAGGYDSSRSGSRRRKHLRRRHANRSQIYPPPFTFQNKNNLQTAVNLPTSMSSGMNSFTTNTQYMAETSRPLEMRSKVSERNGFTYPPQFMADQQGGHTGFNFTVPTTSAKNLIPRFHEVTTVFHTLAHGVPHSAAHVVAHNSHARTSRDDSNGASQGRSGISNQMNENRGEKDN